MCVYLRYFLGEVFVRRRSVLLRGSAEGVVRSSGVVLPVCVGDIYCRLDTRYITSAFVEGGAGPRQVLPVNFSMDTEHEL